MPDLTFRAKNPEQVAAAFKKTQDATNKAKEAGDKLNATMRLTGDESKKLDRLQVEIAKRHETAGQKYVRQLGDARKALAGNKNEAVLLRKETTRLTEEYLRSSDAGRRTARDADQQLRRQAATQRALNNAVRELPPLYNQADRQIEQMGTTFTGTIGQWERSLQGTKAVTRSTFGADGIALITKFGGAIAGLMAPIGLVTRGVSGISERLRSAASTAKGTAATEGSLRQLADNQGDFDRMMRYVDTFQQQGVVGSRQESLDLTFALASAGRLASRDALLYSRLGRAQFDPDLPGLVKSATTIASSFGRKETGSDEQICSKAARGAEISPGTMSQYMEAVARVGVAARGEGLRDEEGFAATAVLAQSIGDPNQAATALEAFIYATAELPEMAGLSIADRVTNIRERKLSTAERFKLLGRKEAVRGYGLLAGNLGKYRRELVNIDRGNTDTSTLAAKLAIRAPIADTTRVAAKARLDMERRTLAQGAAQELLDQVDDRLMQNAEQNARRLLGSGFVGGLGASIVHGLGKTGQFIGNFREPLETLRIAEQRGELTAEESQQLNELKKQLRLQEQQLRSQEKTSKLLESIEAKMGQGGVLVGNE